MKRVVIIVMLILLLIGCSKPQTNEVFDEITISNSYSNKITGSVVGTESYVKETEYTEEVIEEDYTDEQIEETSIDALKIQMLMTGSKEGNFYPQIQTSSNGEDALKEKTKALHQIIVKLDEEIDADQLFGVRFFTEKQKDIEQEQTEDND